MGFNGCKSLYGKEKQGNMPLRAAAASAFAPSRQRRRRFLPWPWRGSAGRRSGVFGIGAREARNMLISPLLNFSAQKFNNKAGY